MLDPTTTGILVGGAVTVVGALAAPAQKAVAKLIGAHGGISVAKLKANEQAIKDKTAADSVMSKALAKAAAERAVQDPDLVDRTLERMAREELSKQENREAVARIALEHLSALKPDEVPQQPQDVDEDWLNLFGAHAEKASSERLRDLWGRVLAGEIRSKGSFSPSTMQVVAILDADIASKFELLSSYVANSNQIIREESFNSGELFNIISELSAVGLIFYDNSSANLFKKDEEAQGVYTYGNYAIHVIKPKEKNFNIPAIFLTNAGRQIFALLSVKFTSNDVERIAKFIKSTTRNAATVRWGLVSTTPAGIIGIIDPVEIPDQSKMTSPWL